MSDPSGFARPLAKLLARDKQVLPWLAKRLEPCCFQVDPALRGLLKQTLVSVGYAAQDLAGYVTGDALPLELRKITRTCVAFILRNYQRESAETFYQSGRV